MKPTSDTIAAIATPMGEGGIGLIRISGSKSLNIALKLFHFFSDNEKKDLTPQQIYFGKISDPKNGEIIDEALLTWFRSPKSYTREDVVEISVHGGSFVTSRALKLVLDLGARLAEPGEFTKRAFVNGRIDLSQAEAVADIIHAMSDKALKSALAQLQGVLSQKLTTFYEQLVSLLAQLETAIDFPEEGLEFKTKQEILKQTQQVNKEIEKLIFSYSEGKIFRDGAYVTLIGKPNVGKSSLFNLLLEEDRAIVTSVSGTTRDVLEEKIRIKDIHINLIDSAGLRSDPDPIEEQGIKRTLSALNQTDLALVILDGSEKLDLNDEILFREIKAKPCIIVINKCDLPKKLDLKLLNSQFSQLIRISAKKKTGIRKLLDLMYELITKGKQQREPTIITRERHLMLLVKTKESLLTVCQSIEKGFSEELIAVGVSDALEFLGMILGKTIEEDLLDKIFKEFCIGK